jgi:hypothetical protein
LADKKDIKKRIEKKLNDQLQLIKSRQNNDLKKVIFLPGMVRLNSQKIPLHGEISGRFVIIYDQDENEALKTLFHEVQEYYLFPLIKSYEETIVSRDQIIALQQSTIHRLLYRLRERSVDDLCDLDIIKDGEIE